MIPIFDSEFRNLSRILAIAVVIHNIEEWLSFSNFLSPAAILGLDFRTPSAQSMEIALLLVTLFSLGLIAWASSGIQRSHKDWIICWLGSIYCANVFLPHILASLLSGTYSPGVVSATLFVLPINLLMFRRALLENRLSRPQLSTAILAGVVSLPLSIFLSIGAADLLVEAL